MTRPKATSGKEYTNMGDWRARYGVAAPRRSPLLSRRRALHRIPPIAHVGIFFPGSRLIALVVQTPASHLAPHRFGRFAADRR